MSDGTKVRVVPPVPVSPDARDDKPMRVPVYVGTGLDRVEVGTCELAWESDGPGLLGTVQFDAEHEHLASALALNGTESFSLLREPGGQVSGEFPDLA